MTKRQKTQQNTNSSSLGYHLGFTRAAVRHTNWLKLKVLRNSNSNTARIKKK